MMAFWSKKVHEEGGQGLVSYQKSVLISFLTMPFPVYYCNHDKESSLNLTKH